MLLRLFALTALLFSAHALAAPARPVPPKVGIASPNGDIAVEITTDYDGRPSYAVSRKGKPVIAPSRLGFLFLGAPKFERNFVIAGHKTATFDGTWEQPWGERPQHPQPLQRTAGDV